MYVYFRALIYKTGGYFKEKNYIRPVPGWIHIVLNYRTSSRSPLPRLSAYVNTYEVLTDSTEVLEDTASGDGRIILGRAFSDIDDHYTSMEVDEVMFYREWLDPTEIDDLFAPNRFE